MSTIELKKAKIKDDLFLEVEFTEQLPGHSKKDTKMTCTVPVHEDLKNAFQDLHKHLAVLCDEAKAPKQKDWKDTVIEGFFVRGFSIAGSEENEGVTISGSKDGKYGTVNLNTPFTKYSSDEYPFVSELAEDIQKCHYEVEQYLFEGKRAPEKQMSIDFGDDDDIPNEE